MDDSDIDITDLYSDDDTITTTKADYNPSPRQEQSNDFDQITSTPAQQIIKYSNCNSISPPCIEKCCSTNIPTVQTTIKRRQRPKTAKRSGNRSPTKPKIRTRPQSAYPSKNTKTLRNAMKRFEQLQRSHVQNKHLRSKKTAKYSPKQWFDSRDLKSVDDWRDENQKLRKQINGYIKKETILKSQMNGLKNQNAKRSKEIEALITVALQNNESKMGKTKNSKKQCYNQQSALLMQLRHEQSICSSLRNKLKKCKKEIKQKKIATKTKSSLMNVQFKFDLVQKEVSKYKKECKEYRKKCKKNVEKLDKMQCKIDENENKYQKEINRERENTAICNDELIKEKKKSAKVEGECEKLMLSLKESMALSERQSEQIQKLQNDQKFMENDVKKYAFYDQFVDNLYNDRKNKSNDGRSEIGEMTSLKCMEMIKDHWKLIHEMNDADTPKMEKVCIGLKDATNDIFDSLDQIEMDLRKSKEAKIEAEKPDINEVIGDMISTDTPLNAEEVI